MKILSSLKRKRRQLNEIHANVQNIKFFMRRLQLEDKILHSTEPGVSSERYCDHDIVLSLTTYGRRLEDVCFTIESLMELSRADMEKLAADLGVEVKRTMNKSEIAALLCAVTDLKSSPAATARPLPELGAEGPVE